MILLKLNQRIGIFILNPNYGVKEIQECTKSGFHPHTTNPPLFEDCDHVDVDEQAKIEIIDLRMTKNRI